MVELRRTHSRQSRVAHHRNTNHAEADERRAVFQVDRRSACAPWDPKRAAKLEVSRERSRYQVEHRVQQSVECQTYHSPENVLGGRHKPSGHVQIRPVSTTSMRHRKQGMEWGFPVERQCCHSEHSSRPYLGRSRTLHEDTLVTNGETLHAVRTSQRRRCDGPRALKCLRQLCVCSTIQTSQRTVGG